jgi:hypothetical protein
MNHDSWVVVDEVAGDLHAEILKGLLESYDIEAWISQEGAGRAYQFGVGRLGRVQILVHKLNSQRAREILDQYYAGELEANVEDSGQDIDDVGMDDGLPEE